MHLFSHRTLVVLSATSFRKFYAKKKKGRMFEHIVGHFIIALLLYTRLTIISYLNNKIRHKTTTILVVKSVHVYCNKRRPDQKSCENEKQFVYILSSRGRIFLGLLKTGHSIRENWLPEVLKMDDAERTAIVNFF